ncbi:MAG: ATP-binding protein, partial [candidate division NC10 bacterium]
MIQRGDHLRRLTGLLREFPVVGLVGPRQVGKTTLARALARGWRGAVTHLDLESPADLARLADPALALGPLRGLVVIDEFQRRPDLLTVLRVLADRPRRPARFLVLGSASPDLIRGSSETLAGRIAYQELSGFSLAEVDPARLGALWLRGGFPRSFLARTEPATWRWRQQFIRTFLERDLPTLGLRLGADTLHRFWTMLAHYHAQVWNGSELARAFGVADTTVRGYLDLLASAFMVRLLTPWSENLAKRQVKAPKVYLRDTGLLHALLGIRTADDLDRHPKVGASWEGFMLSEVIQRLGAEPRECHFWATHGGVELDLLVVRGRRRLGFEFKRTSGPSVTRSMHVALADLRLERLDVIHAG